LFTQVFVNPRIISFSDQKDWQANAARLPSVAIPNIQLPLPMPWQFVQRSHAVLP
jgi:hypothetical protein